MKKTISFFLAFMMIFLTVSLAACNETVDLENETEESEEIDRTSKPTEDPVEKPTEESTEKPTEDSEHNQEGDGTIMIGMTAPLSGDSMLIGRAVQHGAQGAIDEINAAGGIEGMLLSLNVADDKNDPSLVSGLYFELMSAGMKISLGSVTSSCCKEFAGEAEQDGLFVLTPTATDRELFEYDRLYGMELADMDEMDVLIEYLEDVCASSDSKLGVIYCEDYEPSKRCKDYLVANGGSLVNGAIFVDAEVAWDEYDGEAAERLSTCENIVILYPIDEVAVASLVGDIDFIKRYEGCKTERFISLYTFYDFDWGIVWDPQSLSIDVLMPFDALATSGEFADFSKKYSDFHYSDAMVALGYDAVYAIYEALLCAIEDGTQISADMSADDFGEILDGVFSAGFEFDALTGGDSDGRGIIAWHPDGRANKKLCTVTFNPYR